MKKNIKKAFSALGIELKRTGKAVLPPIASVDTKNITLELIGPSGIGKSTLHSKMTDLLKHRWNTQYMPIEELTNEIDPGLDELYRKCLHLKASALYGNRNTFERYTSSLRFHINRTYEDRYLKLSGLLHKGGWFLDDGFVDIFNKQIIEIVETNSIEKKVLEKFFGGRRFVFLNAPVNYIMENLRERQLKSKGKDNDWLSFYNENDTKDLIQKRFENKHKLMELSTSYGARFWEIEITDRNDGVLNIIRKIESNVVKTNKKR